MTPVVFPRLVAPRAPEPSLRGVSAFTLPPGRMPGPPDPVKVFSR
jgi:hypothetical protein